MPLLNRMIATLLEGYNRALLSRPDGSEERAPTNSMSIGTSLTKNQGSATLLQISTRLLVGETLEEELTRQSFQP